MTKITYIPGEIANAAIDEHGNRKPVTRTQHVFDDAKGKSQAEVNADVDDSLANRYTKAETYNKTELNSMITTPNQEYVTLVAESGDTLSDIFDGVTGAADTIYRVGNWDGEQYDTSAYSEYAWDGTVFQFLSKKQPGIDDVPTKDSPNFVRSAGVYNAISLSGLSTSLLTELTDKIITDFSDSISWSTGTVNDSGAVVTSVKWGIRASVSVSPSDIFLFATYKGSIAGVYFIDSSLNYLSEYAYPEIVGNSGLVRVPNGAAYMRVKLYRKSDKDNDVDVSGIINQVAATIRVFKVQDRIVQKDNKCFNIWDEQIVKGKVLSNGNPINGNGFISKNFIPVLSNTYYYFRIPPTTYTGQKIISCYNAQKTFINSIVLSSVNTDNNGCLLRTPENCKFVRFSIAFQSDSYSYNNDICINVSRPFTGMSPKNGDYVAHDVYENYIYDEVNGSDNINNINGVKIMKLRLMENINFTINNSTHLPTYISIQGKKFSNFYEVPKEGIYIYGINNSTYKIYFFTKSGDTWSYATSYSHYNHRNYSQHASYFPYAENLYYVIEDTTSGMQGDIMVCYGKIEKNGGRLPNLFSTAIYQSYDSVNDVERICFSTSGAQMLTYGRFYGSILRVQDVKKIVAAPPYCLVARIYRVDEDEKKIVYVDDKFLCTDHIVASAGIAGVSEIDFSEYEFDGYIMLGIASNVEETSNNLFRVPFMGMLANYKSVQQSVFVEWRSVVSVEYDSVIPAVIKKNLDVITDYTFAPDLQSSPSAEVGGGYTNWNRTYLTPIPAMGRCTSWWYAGGNNYNVPHMHVNPKSYITASKNKYSRVYVGKYQHQDVVKNNNLYGSVCSATLAAILGLPCGLETMEITSRLHENFDYRDYRSFDEIEAGDIFGQLDGKVVDGRTILKPKDYGHVIYIAEKIVINGEVFCLNSFEGYSPWVGWDTYINHSSHVNYTMQNPSHDNFNFISYKSSRWFGSDGSDKGDGNISDKPFKVLARPNYKVYQTIRNAYGKYGVQDYQVTEIMCDRGTDAVYCIGEYLGLTVTDGTTNIDLYKDGVFYSTVDLTTCTIKPTDAGDNVVVYDICDKLSESGYYEVYVDGEKKESFYVPPTRFTYWEADGDDVVIYFDPDEEDDITVSFLAYYGNDIYDEGSRKRLHFWNNIDGSTTYQKTFVVNDEEIVKTVCEYRIPRVTIWCDGIEREITSIPAVLRKTPYGTYWIRLLDRDLLTCLQRAGADER